MDMVYMTTCMTLTMIPSSTLGDGDTDGLGDLGAAGTADSGDGITLTTGATGDGDLDGVTLTGADITGTTDVTPTEGEGADSATASTADSPSGPATWLTAVTQASPEVLSADVPTVSLQEPQAHAHSEVETVWGSELITATAPHALA